MTVTVKHRGEEVGVAFTDHGYEPDTNTHEIDWQFIDGHLNSSATDAEQEAILDQLHKIVADPGFYDGIAQDEYMRQHSYDVEVPFADNH